MEPRRVSIRPRESDLLQKGKADSQGRWIASGDSTRPCESALAAARVAITAQIDLDGGDAQLPAPVTANGEVEQQVEAAVERPRVGAAAFVGEREHLRVVDVATD